MHSSAPVSRRAVRTYRVAARLPPPCTGSALQNTSSSGCTHSPRQQNTSSSSRLPSRSNLFLSLPKPISLLFFFSIRPARLFLAKQSTTTSTFSPSSSLSLPLASRARKINNIGHRRQSQTSHFLPVTRPAPTVTAFQDAPRVPHFTTEPEVRCPGFLSLNSTVSPPSVRPFIHIPLPNCFFLVPSSPLLSICCSRVAFLTTKQHTPHSFCSVVIITSPRLFFFACLLLPIFPGFCILRRREY